MGHFFHPPHEPRHSLFTASVFFSSAHVLVSASADLLSQDLSLPKSMVQRLAKGVLPPNTIVGKDALLALHKSATVFVNFIASK